MLLRLLPLVSAVFLLVQPAAAETTRLPELKLPETVFVQASAFQMRGPPGQPLREVLLYMFRSPLGSKLAKRDLTAAERMAFQELCRSMAELVEEQGGKPFDDYFIDLADGQGDPATVPPERRAVFGFERETGCEAGPIRITVQ